MEICNFCGNIMTNGENHTCSFHTIDSTYSHSEPFSENTSSSGQLSTPPKLPSFGIFSHIRVSYPQTNRNAFSTGFSENGGSRYRPENDFPEPFNISPTVLVPTAVGEEGQRGSGIPDLLNARGRDEDEMSRQEYRWLSWNNDKMNCMDSAESVNRTNNSDNCNMSELRNLVSNNDLLPRRNVPENNQTKISEYVNDGHTSLDMHSILCSKSEERATYVKENISSKTINNAATGPSRMYPRKKNFSCPTCNKDFIHRHHRDNHYRIHTGEKPFVCEFCRKAFSQKVSLDRHIRTHTGEKPYECSVCGKAFATSSDRNRHQRKIH